MSGKGKSGRRELFVPPLPKAKTIFHNHAEQHLILDKLPKDKVHKFCKPVSKHVVNLSGPYSEETSDDPKFAHAYGTSFSLYPYYKGNASREGDPICDSYRMQVHNNVTLFCLADGCNWGERPRQASNRAKDAFVGYLQQHLSEFKSPKDVGPHLVHAIALAHIAIVHDKEDVFMAGTTTLVGGLLVKNDVSKSDSPTFTLMAISVGDCKIYHYVRSEKKVYDVTATNRNEVEDAKDPGGRIGPYIDQGNPDLRNLDVCYQVCNEGDVVLVVSDGVHDNLDPISLGKIPKELGLEGDTHAHWKTVDKARKNVAKEKYMTELLERLIAECPAPTPQLISKRLIRHCRNVTESSRVFMEQNPQLGMAGLSYDQYPGKMDHTTCIAFKVREYEFGAYEQGDEIQSLNQDVLKI